MEDDSGGFCCCLLLVWDCADFGGTFLSFTEEMSARDTAKDFKMPSPSKIANQMTKLKRVNKSPGGTPVRMKTTKANAAAVPSMQLRSPKLQAAAGSPAAVSDENSSPNKQHGTTTSASPSLNIRAMVI